jgi:NitT/TauT family transport system ATP-binding protein
VGASVQVDGVCKSYGDTSVLSDTSVSLQSGSFVSLVGPSGCGKSTLLDVVAGLREPSSGRVLIAGEPSFGPRRETGIVFQETSTLPWRTVLDNVAFVQEVQGVRKEERYRTARDRIRLVGLSGFEHHYPHQLSGGMRQRVAIARMLSADPDLILADEPFGALDEQTRLVLGLELLRIVRGTGATVLFVTHSIQEAVLLSDRVLVMSARPGRILEDVEVGLPPARDLEALGSPAGAELVRRIWEPLRTEAQRALDEQQVA